ncbi:hypothetical protein [Francisella adeliensis]|uniref:Uncharacterized protein n=2 Tax=Francisella adeliensis TaxID=2007306 RepID=A0ABX6KEC8_9GAMM|nr:hypothetical protein [Francisella adeliensis]MBK2086527.1 hypothetical protein [Francisella adeliensis]MBK2096155.1 hypothetical protein [Francisella adeliensis]QIW12680.1 hypothetical protein FZC43_08510 [Francisella adeliensis]QIW14556.1 hypothetical protein FZC44_08505 [Francisella adeliensis]
MKRSLFLLLIQLFSSMSFFLATIVVARYLGPEDFGDFSAAYSVAVVAYIVCLLGADMTAINVIATAVKARENGVIKAFVIYVFTVVALLSIIYYMIAFIGYLVAKDILYFKDDHPVFVAVLFIPFMALTFFFYRVIISFSMPVFANILFKVLIHFSMLLLASLMFYDEFFRDSHIAIVLFMIPWILSLCIMALFLFKRMKIFVCNPEKIDYVGWLSSGLSGLPYTLALLTIPYLSIIGAEVFLNNEESVGIFATVIALSQLIATNFSACIQSVDLEPIAEALYDKKFIIIRRIFNRNTLNITLLSLILIEITLLYGADILSVYGKEYVVDEGVLLMFIITQCVILMGCLAAPTLIYMGKNKFVASTSLLLIILLIAFISLLGYIYQEIGIAFAVLLSVSFVFLVQILYAYKLTLDGCKVNKTYF